MPEAVEALLEELARGANGAVERLVPLLYQELRRIARSQRRRLRPGQPLDTTELVHETYLKLGKGRLPARDEGHLLALLARAMRQVLVDAARHQGARKRGGAVAPDPLDEGLCVSQPRADDVLDVEAALAKLRQLDERLVQVVECRFFSGLTEEEAGVALGVSTRTVHRDWLRARAWLRRELGRDATHPAEAAGEGSEGAGGGSRGHGFRGAG
jgi:RNA polymerase sigma factor (TIGR02999 family)